MIYGQWHGSIIGEVNADILLSVDKKKEDQFGSIGLIPRDGTFPTILKVIFKKVTPKEILCNLIGFIGFSNEGLVLPQNNTQIQMSGTGTAQLKIEKCSDENIQIIGEWKTNLGFSGKVTLKKVRPPKAEPIEKIISWDEFKKGISDPKRYPWGTFFRGQPNSIYPLQTRFHRERCWDLYRYYFEIIPKLFDYLGVLNNTRYPLDSSADFGSPLLLAQHHGFPTPLLDWTLSPYVAAYFAFSTIAKEVDAKSVRVFAFHKERWLNEQPQYNRGNILTPGLTIRPLEIPLAGNKRGVAQMARAIFSSVENIENVLTFVLFEPNKIQGEMPAHYLDYFDISISEKDKAMDDLRSMNIQELTMFPELDTACKLLRKKYFGNEDADEKIYV